MPRYEHIAPKQQAPRGYATDPPQDVSNASGGLLDKELNLQTAATIGLGVMYGKKVLTTGFNAAIQQTGSTQYEKFAELGSKVLKYATIAKASGSAAPFAVAGAIIVDTAVFAVESIQESNEIRLGNNRLMEEQGVRRKLGVISYD